MQSERTARVRATYVERRAGFTAAAEQLERTSRNVSHLRTITFLLSIVAVVLVERDVSVLTVAFVVLAVASFITLVVVHRRLRSREAWQRELAELNEAGLQRLDRAWDRLPPRAAAVETSGHPYAEDLDLFGTASVAQLLGPGSSVIGMRILDEWLLEPTHADEVRRRQQAVAELAAMIDLRERLAIHGRRSRAVRSRDIDRFLSWAEQPPWFLPQRALLLAAWVLPLATALLLVLHLTGSTGALWVLPAVAAAALSLRICPRIHHTFDAAFGREGMFAHFPELIGVVADAHFESSLLRELQERVRPDGASAETHIARLRSIMHLADLRTSSIHFLVQLATLWDFHVIAGLERWQRRHGTAARDWLHAAAAVEALAGLATLAYDHPEWAFPELVDDPEPAVAAEALGHPLIADGVRVHNDVAVGPPGTFLLVTGSNMSGKSTLLRAIGVNVVLAGAGAPCCAQRLGLTPLRVRTSIHVQDSLARGMSHFMAELERLKQVVDAADAARADGPAVLFLLDEILNGTNTAERRIAARRVIRHLTKVGAIGAVTTHDLELVDDPVLAPRAQLVHFQETFDSADDGGGLSFDYRLREGLATSTNALKLMRYVGLPEE